MVQTQVKSNYCISNASCCEKEKKNPNEALLNSLFQRNSHFRTAATNYGLSREKQAREMFAKHKSVENAHIHDCGLVVNYAFPFQAASPDVKKNCENGECGLLEIKCPFLAGDMFISEACVQFKNFILLQENGKNLT